MRVTSERPRAQGPADPKSTVSQRVEHRPLEMILVLTGPGQGHLEFVDATAVHAFGRFGTLGGIACRQQVLAQIEVRLLGRTDQLA